jgi:hypothetical protein
MFGSREGSVIGGFLGCLFGSASRVIGFQGDVGLGRWGDGAGVGWFKGFFASGGDYLGR